MTVEESDDYEFIEGSTKTICVCGSQTRTETFDVRMKKLGDINITVNVCYEVVVTTNILFSALTMLSFSLHFQAVTIADDGSEDGGCPAGSDMSVEIGLSDTIVKPIKVEAEGVKREYTISDYVCVANGEVSRNYTLPLPPDSELIADSERGTVCITVD